MAVESPIVKIVYSGNGTTNEFPIPFTYGNENEIAVYYRDLDEVVTKITTNIEVDIYNNKIIYPFTGPSLAVGTSLTIIRETAPLQGIEFDNTGYFKPVMVESAVDKLTRITQEHAEKLNRAIKFPLDSVVEEGDSEEFLTLIQGSEASALAARDAAIVAAGESADSAIAALESEENAAISEQNTTFYANLFLFEEFIKVTDLDSPVSGVTNGSLYLADDENGSIDFNLPALSAIDSNWKAAFIKQSDTANVLNIIAESPDTIKGLGTFEAIDKGIGCVFFKLSDTEWGIRYFAFTESSGMSSLPIGGDTGAALVKNSNTDLDVVWDDFEIEGYSARFNTNWYSKGLRDTLEKILNITYLGPLISSFSGSSNVLREKGNTVSSITLSVDVAKRSNAIERIRFLQGATVIADNFPPAQTGSGVTTAPYNTPFSDNRMFTVEVTDETGSNGGPTTVSANVSYTFIYPYYTGAANPGISAAVVATLSKLIISSTATLNRSFTAANGNVYYFAYPAVYGALTSILDENGFEVFGSFTRRIENITGLDGNAVSYNIYESNNPVVAGTTNFTFKR